MPEKPARLALVKTEEPTPEERARLERRRYNAVHRILYTDAPHPKATRWLEEEIARLDGILRRL